MVPVGSAPEDITQHMGGLPPAGHPWAYFKDGEEANEWLEFDAGGEECEQAAWSDPDRYGEWVKWRAADRA